MSLPGDDMVPMLETTDAITIDARAEQIWPWLVQIGPGRAGFNVCRRNEVWYRYFYASLSETGQIPH
jgi:hypothetical protein